MKRHKFIKEDIRNLWNSILPEFPRKRRYSHGCIAMDGCTDAMSLPCTMRSYAWIAKTLTPEELPAVMEKFKKENGSPNILATPKTAYMFRKQLAGEAIYHFYPKGYEGMFLVRKNPQNYFAIRILEIIPA